MADTAVDKKALIEGERPIFKASYGKLMMWFFLVSDAFTFSALLITYGALRVSATTEGFAWSNPENVFTHTPFLYEFFHIEAPLVFVGIMTFILIISSVTMVLAVEAGHRKSKNEVAKWVLFTIIGGATFLGCQAYEWYHFIIGTADGAYAAEIADFDGSIVPDRVLEEHAMVQLMPTYASDDDHHVTALTVRDGATITNETHIEMILDEASHTHAGTYMLEKQEAKLLNISQLNTGSDVVIAYPVREENEDIFNTKEKQIIGFRLADGHPVEERFIVDKIASTAPVMSAEERANLQGAALAEREEQEKWNLTDGGANLFANEYGPAGFADLFFFVTGFHGTHVFSGVILLVMLFINVVKGTYDRRGHYEMTEKIGLYWHFVDLVWVFVFTFFYLI